MDERKEAFFEFLLRELPLTTAGLVDNSEGLKTEWRKRFKSWEKI